VTKTDVRHVSIVTFDWSEIMGGYNTADSVGDFTFRPSLSLSQFAERNLKLNAKVHT